MNRLLGMRSSLGRYIGWTMDKSPTLYAAVCPAPPTCPPLENAANGNGKKHGGGALYKKLALFVCVPAIVLLAVNTFVLNAEEHEGLENYTQYDYLLIRNKRFPWGDGTKSLFHNPHKNALPGQGEAAVEKEEEEGSEVENCSMVNK